MKSIFLFVLISSILASGCNKVVMKYYGVRNPEFENSESLSAFKNSNFGSEIPFYIVKYQMWKNNEILHIQDVFVFSGKGEYIPYKDSLKPNCSGPAELFLTELNPSRKYYYSDEWSLDRFLENLEKPDCMGPAELKKDSVDFYIFMTWANFYGKKIYKSKTKRWIQTLRNNKNITYRLYMVNQDLQQCWTTEQKNRFEKLQ